MLTKEKIEEARERLKTRVEYFCQAVEMEAGAKAAAFDDIDALCAAASEQENLVGRKVRIVKGYYSKETGVMVKRCYYVRFDWPPDGTEGNAFNRDDFELLEGDDKG